MNLFSFAFVDPTLFLSTMTLKYGKNFADFSIPVDHPDQWFGVKQIMLRGPDNPKIGDWEADIEHVDYVPFNEWPSARALVDNISSTICGSPQLGFPRPVQIGKVYIESVPAGGFIGWSIADSEYARKHQRFRLLASPCTGGAWHSGPESMGPIVGNLTYFNTYVLHSITNLGPVPQISVIVDIRKPALQ